MTGSRPASQLPGERSLDKLVRDVLDLVDRSVSEITDAEIDARLKDLLRSRRCQGRPAGPVEAAAAAPADPGMRGREDDAAGGRDSVSLTGGPSAVTTLGTTVRRRSLGRELRHLRESQGLRLDEAARRVGVALPALARIERGKATAKPACLRALLDLYGVGILEQRRAMAEMAGDRRRRDWWAFSQETLPSGQSIRAHVEAEASSLRTYQSQVIHELVQTEDYARDAITAANPKRTPEETDRLIALRMQRQKLLVHPEPLRLWIILDESAIRRPARSPGAMRGQLIHLKEVSQLPNVTLQVLSFSAGLHPALNGSFTIIEFPGALDPDIVCCEAPGGLFVMDERETVVRGRAAVFDHLRAAALPPGISADLISDAGRYC